MTRYAICCGGFQSSWYYRTYEEAKTVANFYTHYTGNTWGVKRVYFPIEMGE